jgi:methionyl-tRNA formyltransferase
MEQARSLRVAFLGNDAWSVPSLEKLAASRHDIVVVATREPRPGGRGNRLIPTPVAQSARRLGLLLAEVATVKRGAGFDALVASRPDVLAVVAYGEILPRSVLEIPAIAPVNLHFSLLPRLRGASPVQTALLLGLEETGVTTIVMDAGLDTGPIIRQRSAAVSPDDDAGSLGARLATSGAAVLVETLDVLASGEASPVPQDGLLATFAPRLGPEDRRLDWSKPARALVNRVRALSPSPAVAVSFRGENLKLYRAEAVEATEAAGAPGTIADVEKDGFVVATGEGGFRPLEVAPAGRKRMSAAEFVRGYRPTPGEQLS